MTGTQAPAASYDKTVLVNKIRIWTNMAAEAEAIGDVEHWMRYAEALEDLKAEAKDLGIA